MLKMKDYNIMDEAETIANQYTLRKSEYIGLPDTARATASDEAKGLLVKVQQLVTCLEGAYREAVMQGDRERELLLYNAIECRPDLFSIDLEFCNEPDRVEGETNFIVMAKLWIREIEELL